MYWIYTVMALKYFQNCIQLGFKFTPHLFIYILSLKVIISIYMPQQINSSNWIEISTIWINYLEKLLEYQIYDMIAACDFDIELTNDHLNLSNPPMLLSIIV